MATKSSKEVVGHVVGYSVIVNPEQEGEQRFECATLAEAWAVADRAEPTREDCEFDGGARFHTRIQGPDGVIDEESGMPQRGETQLQPERYSGLCQGCGKQIWWPRPVAGSRCWCEKCSDDEL